MKRFLKALPVLLVGGLALTGCTAAGSTSTDANTMNVQVSTQAQGDALGDGATSGDDVLGAEAIGSFSVFKQLGLSGATVGLSTTNTGKGQTAEYSVKGIATDKVNAAQQAAAQQFEQAKTQWKATSGNEKKADAEFYSDATMKQQVAQVPGLAVMTLLPALTEKDGEHTGTITPRFVSALGSHNTEVTLTFPGEVTLEGTPAGVEAAGKEVTLTASEVKDNEAIKVSFSDPAPVMSWWLSLILWVLGLIVTVLLITIALAPRRRD